MHVVCCQYDIAWEDKPANYAKVTSLLERAKPAKHSLVVLPEMSFTGFSMNVPVVAEAAEAASKEFLKSTAQTFGVFLVGGVVTRAPDGRGRNLLVAVSPDGAEIACYAKMRPFTLGDEATHYAAGDEVVTFQCDDCQVAPFICYDLRFPELFRIAAAKRPELFVVIANWPVARIHHWTRLLQARAIENQAYVVGVNRCGRDPRYVYCGGSIIIDPHGEIVADGGSEENIISADLDLEWLRRYRRELPFLNDMRSEASGRNDLVVFDLPPDSPMVTNRRGAPDRE